MAQQERLAALIEGTRRLVGDEFNADTAALITDFLTENGTGWTAAAIAYGIEKACDEILNTAWMTLKSGDKLARMFGEYVKEDSLAVVVQGNVNDQIQGLPYCVLPEDFGWMVTARFRADSGEKTELIDFSDSVRHVMSAATEVNPEEESDPKGVIMGSSLVLHYARSGYDIGASGVTPSVRIVYIRVQPKLVPGQSNDVLMRSTWDTQILAATKKLLSEFKR